MNKVCCLTLFDSKRDYRTLKNNYDVKGLADVV